LKIIYPEKTAITGRWDVFCYEKIQVKYEKFEYNLYKTSAYNRNSNKVLKPRHISV
jgi:hypothetical protein